MSERMKNWFREKMGFFILLVLLIGMSIGAGVNYYINYRSMANAIRLGVFISNTDDQIYILQRKP